MLDPFFIYFIFIDTTGVCHVFDPQLGPTRPRRRLDWKFCFGSSCIHVYVVYIWSVFIYYGHLIPPLASHNPFPHFLCNSFCTWEESTIMFWNFKDGKIGCMGFCPTI